jgi:hypothetical protein
LHTFEVRGDEVKKFVEVGPFGTNSHSPARDAIYAQGLKATGGLRGPWWNGEEDWTLPPELEALVREKLGI